jgi:hypothetical protein
MSAFAVLTALVAAIGGGLSCWISARGGAPVWASVGAGILMVVVLAAFLPLVVR